MKPLMRWLPILVLVGLTGSGYPCLQARAAPAPPAATVFTDTPKALVDEVWQTVEREFVDGSFNRQDWQQVRTQLLERDYETKDEAYQAIRVALKSLGDPFTRFLTPSEYQGLLEQTSGEWIGAGFVLRLSEETGQPVISRLYKNSPAEQVGLALKDQLVAIDGEAITGLNLETLTNRIRGEKGSRVALDFLRGSQKLTVTITRAVIETPAIEAQLKEEAGVKLGYIQLQEFSARAAAEFGEALDSLAAQGAVGWVLDLRGNPGGRVDAATDVVELLLDRGTIVIAVDRKGKRETVRANRHARTNRPVVVLVDRGSASASEIVAAALQENRRAVVIGTPTFGKGVIQQMNTLADGSGLNVTIAYYQTPTGRDIHKRGIVPDVVVSMPESLRQSLVTSGGLGGESDPQYKRAISVLIQQLRSLTVLKP